MVCRLKKSHLLFAILVALFLTVPIHAEDKSSELVAFNVQTLKVHKLSCTWAKRCTKNCITIPRADAYKHGGVACKVCGG